MTAYEAKDVSIEDLLEIVKYHYEFQAQRWGRPNHPVAVWVAIIVEELGKIQAAEQHNVPGDEPRRLFLGIAAVYLHAVMANNYTRAFNSEKNAFIRFRNSFRYILGLHMQAIMNRLRSVNDTTLSTIDKMTEDERIVYERLNAILNHLAQFSDDDIESFSGIFDFMADENLYYD